MFRDGGDVVWRCEEEKGEERGGPEDEVGGVDEFETGWEDGGGGDGGDEEEEEGDGGEEEEEEGTGGGEEVSGAEGAEGSHGFVPLCVPLGLEGDEHPCSPCGDVVI